MSDRDTATGEQVARGSCLCGAVRYEVRGPLRGVVNCHCGQCLKTHGHFGAYTSARRADLCVVNDRGLTWFRSSDEARRGFCRNCGASLFWDADGRETISVAAGTLDQPTHLETVAHIYVSELADYYRLDDGIPRRPRSLDT